MLDGDPGRVIPEFVATERIDLLVMATIARTGVPGMLIGNTAERMLQSVDCSVLAIKPRGFVSPVRPKE
jgi:nucleotide-binding universal stress UspA family protein